MTLAPETVQTGKSNPRPTGFRHVVFHADDFGFNEPITRGIIEGFERGILTSTSALPNAPFLDLALSFWKTLEQRRQSGDFPSAPLRKSLGDELAPFDFGVHINLTQGRPLTGNQYPPQLLDRNGLFPGIFSLYAKLSLRPRKYREPILRELEAQIGRLKDSSLEITQLNGHQYVEILPTVARLIPDLARRFNIPVVRTAAESRFTPITLFKGEVENWVTTAMKRHYALRLRHIVREYGLNTPDHYCGAAHMARILGPILDHYLRGIPPFNERNDSTGQVTEICLHPATLPGTHTLVDPLGWTDPFESARPKELQFIESSECFELLRNHRVRLARLRSIIN
ncbi:MAG: ChbG/HpnK family deacetylase [Planctomycetaceae bacterium]|nr:ChbG/HpnK family deacetylase [Planctomycetaceae bacterium]